MAVKLYKPSELSNEQYRELPQISGSELVRVHKECPAALKKARTRSKAMSEGVDIHEFILENEKWNNENYRGFDYKDLDYYSSESAVKARLKHHGVPRYSTKKGEELFNMLMSVEPEAIIKPLQDIKDSIEANGKRVVPASEWDKFSAMRDALMKNNDARRIIENAFFECSFVSDDPDYFVKSRPDIITEFRTIDDYKTCASAHPGKFFKDAYRHGYLAKEACKNDMYKVFFGEYPARHTFIAQEKEYPYISAVYQLDEDALKVGRKQYLSAMKKILDARENDVYPGYETQVFKVPGFAEELIEE